MRTGIPDDIANEENNELMSVQLPVLLERQYSKLPTAGDAFAKCFLGPF
jgi:hypothetical protein